MNTVEKVKIMKAFIDGKQIQLKDYNGKWVNWTDAKHREPNWNWETGSYRIKPEPTYRPYENTDEMIADFKERFGVNVPNYAMPLIWVINKEYSDIELIIEFDKIQVGYKRGYCTMSELFADFTYLDGSPVGKLVE